MKDCIEWTGRKWSNGRYGVVIINGKSVSVHRNAYEKAFGKITDDRYVCHKCDNGLCINPEHLFLGTHKENMRDMVLKGRSKGSKGSRRSGELNGNAKLTQSEIEYIRHDRNMGATYSELKKKYGIKSNGHLRNILTGKIW